jgi:transglutaminase-like putative cysteine protease
MQHFSLNFTQKDPQHYYLFPIPRTNIYQDISQLLIPESSQIVKLDQDNQLMIAKADSCLSMNFQHQAKVIATDWRSLQLKKSHNSEDFQQDQYVNYLDQNMRDVADNWKNGEKDLKKITIMFYEKTLEYLSYGQAIKELHPYSQALKEKVTDCGGFATFLMTLLQTQGLVSRLAVGYLIKDSYLQKLKKQLKLKFTWSDLTMHAWLELQTADGSWLPLDPAVDWRYRHGQSRRLANFTHLAADRLLISYGHNHRFRYFQHSYHWPILQHPQLIKENNA